MSDEGLRDFPKYFAHIPYLAAQIYLGVYLLLSIVPPVLFAVDSTRWSAGQQVHEGLFNEFGAQWARVFGDASASQIILIVALSWPLGAVVSEAAYRAGRMTRYHDDFNPDGSDSQLYSVSHFRFRSELMKHVPELRMWDWQNFQFNVFYYSELLLFLLFLALTAAIVRPLVSAPDSLILTGQWFVLAVTCTVAVGILYFFMRVARKNKFEDFRRIHLAVRQSFEDLLSPPTDDAS